MAIALNITVADQPGTGGGGPVDPPPTGGSGTSVTNTATWQGVTFTLSQNCTVGYLGDGKPFFVDPGSAVTVTWSPTETTAGGLAVNCGWKNPVRGLSHAWDARETSYFSAGLKASSTTTTLRANDALCVQRHNPNPTTDAGGTASNKVFSLAFASIICLASAPASPTTTFIPSVGPYANGGTARPQYVLDVTTISFPSYTISSAVRSMTDVLANMGRYNPCWSTPRGAVQRRGLSPGGITTQDAYGRDVAISMAHAGVRLIGNDALADKQTLARYMMMHFVEFYPSVKESGNKWSPDGATNQGMIMPVILALGWLGDTAGLSTLAADIGSNELRQTFRVTSDILTKISQPHSNTPSSDWPVLTLRKTVQSVTGTGPWTLTFTDISSSWNTVWVNNLLIRESGAASSGQALVTSSLSSAKQLTISTMPTPPFQVGDVCYNRANYTQAVNDAEWTISGTLPTVGLRTYDPSGTASYRNLNEWDGQVLCVQAFGFMHSAWNHWRDYVARANAGGVDTNGSSTVYADSFSSTGVRDFWNTHWPTISGVTQTVG